MLHVGAPKSGTTFLQNALWHHREQLREAGFHLPGSRPVDMFRAGLEVRGTAKRWGYDPDELTGTWAGICREAREFPGTTIMSHEVLAAAREPEVEAALRHLDGAEVHLVVTARDLARQVLSEWQERVKNGSSQSFDAFQRGVFRQLHEGELTGLFWRNHHVPDLLRRWTSADSSIQQAHLVVAPPPGSDPRVLWTRFGDAVGFDAEALDPTTTDRAANQTLGAAQVSLLRSVNEALDGRIEQPDYARIVKRQFSQKLLAAHRSDRAVCPRELVAELRAVSEGWVAELTSIGCTVHGGLAELIPEEPASDRPAPDDVDPREQAALGAAVIADLLAERHSRKKPASAPPPRASLVRRAARRLRGRPVRPRR